MSPITKLDLKKTDRQLYNPPAHFTVIDVPPLRFLMIDGEGDPNTAPAYAQAVEALYSVSYALKFASKREHEIDYSVLPLEGLWWAEDMSLFTAGEAGKAGWQWTMMIRQPDHITAEMVTQAVEQAHKKKPSDALARLYLDTYHEGLSVQVMYTGPYADEGPTIAALHVFAMEQGYALSGKHHEIYLSDPRRAAPEKLKTIIRQPVSKA
ncbi:MAG: GyrI-like domain-containing protein [Anaerolineae bacterium]